MRASSAWIGRAKSALPLITARGLPGISSLVLPLVQPANCHGDGKPASLRALNRAVVCVTPIGRRQSLAALFHFGLGRINRIVRSRNQKSGLSFHCTRTPPGWRALLGPESTKRTPLIQPVSAPWNYRTRPPAHQPEA